MIEAKKPRHTFKSSAPKASKPKNGTFSVSDIREKFKKEDENFEVVPNLEARQKPPRSLRLPEMMKKDIDADALMRRVTELPITMNLSE